MLAIFDNDEITVDCISDFVVSVISYDLILMIFIANGPLTIFMAATSLLF